MKPPTETELLAGCLVFGPRLKQAAQTDALPLEIRIAALDAQVAMARLEIALRSSPTIQPVALA